MTLGFILLRTECRLQHWLYLKVHCVAEAVHVTEAMLFGLQSSLLTCCFFRNSAWGANEVWISAWGLYNSIPASTPGVCFGRKGRPAFLSRLSDVIFIRDNPDFSVVV